MNDCPFNDAAASDIHNDRRAEIRQTSILRLALIDAGGVTQLCRITNVSIQGMQATVFGSVNAGDRVRIRVPDEVTLEGTIVWTKGNSVGIKIDQPLPYSSLLRFGGDRAAEHRRRRLPRIQAAAPALLRSGARAYAAELLDISPAGAMVQTPDALPGLGPIILDVPGLPRIPGQVRWVSNGRAGLLFNQAVELRTLTDWLLELFASCATVNTSKTEDYTSVAS
jgi:PilZ domain